MLASAFLAGSGLKWIAGSRNFSINVPRTSARDNLAQHCSAPQRVVRDAQVRAGLAAFDMTAQYHRSAALDRRHDLELAEAHMAGMGRTPSRPAVAEDVRHRDRRP